MTIAGRAIAGGAIADGPIASAGTAYTLTAATGSFTLTGNVAGFVHNYPLTAGSGSFALTGNDVEFRYFNLAAETGAFSLTGINVGLVYSGAPPETTEQPTGGWGGRAPWWDRIRRPSADEINEQRRKLGILPAKTRKAVEKVAEREIAQAFADEQALRDAYSDIESGQLAERATRALRNELAARRQQFRPELPGIVRGLVLEGIYRKAQNDRQRLLDDEEERDVREILALWVNL